MRWTLAACALLLLLHSPAYGQRRVRNGFWLESNSGRAYFRLHCSNCASASTATATSGSLAIGGALSARVLLGLETFGLIDETFGFAEEDSSVVAEAGGLAPVIIWYPTPTRLFLKGGVGPADGTFTLTQNNEDVAIDGVGVGFTVGVGYDLPITRHIAFGLNLGVWVMAMGDVVLPDRTIDDAIATMYHAGISLVVR